MGKSELFSHFAERFEVKRTQSREFFDELTALAEKESSAPVIQSTTRPRFCCATLKSGSYGMARASL